MEKKVIINVLKIAICIFTICILFNVVYLVNKQEKIRSSKEQEQMKAEEKFAEVRLRKLKNVETYKITINNDIYLYQIKYGDDHVVGEDAISMYKGIGKNAEIYSDYFFKRLQNIDDAKERIDNFKQYFTNNGGTWERI